MVAESKLAGMLQPSTMQRRRRYLVQLGIGGFLIVWSVAVGLNGEFWYGAKKKHGILITPETHPAGYWATLGVLSLLGLAMVVPAWVGFVRASKAEKERA